MRCRPMIVLADDLTGAIDVATAVAPMWRSRIFLDRLPDADQVKSRFERGCLPIVATETRMMQPGAAGDYYRRLDAHLADVRIYHKTDSTLRGNMGAEHEALLERFDAPALAFVPAYPATGRTTQTGVHYVNGKPLHQTDFANDPVHPAETSSVVERIGRQTSAPAEYVAIDDHASVAGRLRRDVRILAFDAVTDDDLQTAAATIEAHGFGQIVSGAAALVPYLLEARADYPPPAEVCTSDAPHRVIGFVGSMHPAAAEQARRIISVLNVSAVNVMQPPTESPAAMAAAGDVLFHTGLHDGRHAVAGIEQSEALLARLTSAAGTVATDALRVFIAGGRTSFVVCRALGVNTLNMIKTIEPGIALCLNADRANQYIVIKVGGFGGADVGERAWRLLRAVE